VGSVEGVGWNEDVDSNEKTAVAESFAASVRPEALFPRIVDAQELIIA